MIQSSTVKITVLLLGFSLAAVGVLRAQNNSIGEVFSGDASVRGSVLFSGSGAHVQSGSQIAAGDGAAVLKLDRGGQLRICPKTDLSLSAGAGGKSMVLGLSAGALELDYSLASAADSLITPDFRLQLISPGEFHLAISVSPAGDTCLRSLAGDDASVFVAEMMGSDSYQLSPGKSVLFRAGKISGASAAPAECGCPQTAAPMLAAAAETAPEAAPAEPPAEENKTETKLSGAPENVGHMEVDSTFVYHGNAESSGIYGTVSRLSMSRDNSQLTLALLPQVRGPATPAQTAEKKPGLWHRMRSAVGRLFGG